MKGTHAITSEQLSVAYWIVMVIGVILLICMIINDIHKKKHPPKTVVKTKLIDKHDNSHSSTRTSTSSALGRGIVGAAIAGPIGALAGAATARSETVTNSDTEYTFKVWWSDDTTSIERCKYDDANYRRFIEKIEL